MSLLNRRDALVLLVAVAGGAGTSLNLLGQTSNFQSGASSMTDTASVVNQLTGHGFYLMIAQWELKDGNVNRAVEIINQYRPHILQADGIKLFLVAQDRDDPNHILFYEAYETEAHYKAHAASESFQKYIIQEGLPLVAKRTLNSYNLL